MRLSTLGHLVFSIPLALISIEAVAAHCIYINSYHVGYDWSDRMQRQFEQNAKESCRVTAYYLDAKQKSSQQLSKKASEIASLIMLAKPDVVIAADDAASEFVVQPYLTNSRIPLVYVGINWDPRPYGYPMDNATGMTEIWPTDEVLRILKHTVKQLTKLVVVSADTQLERTNIHYLEKSAFKQNIQVERKFVHTFAEWKMAVLSAQQGDVIYLGTNQSIKEWDEVTAIAWLKQNNQRFTVSSQDFMRPYVMFSLSKSPEEFGNWAAKLSQSIISGMQPWQIPIVPNKHFTPYVNHDLLSLTNYKLPAYVQRNALAYP